MNVRPAVLEFVVADVAIALALYRKLALAFACDSPTEVDQMWNELTGAGYEGHLALWNAVWGMRHAVLRDPDGTPVDLFAPLPSA